MRKQVRGKVTGDRNDKTIRVVVDRRFKHPMYGKIVRGRTVCHTHDEQNAAKLGDIVDIVESRPRSATKRWELVRVVTVANPIQVAAVAESGERATDEAGAVSAWREDEHVEEVTEQQSPSSETP